MYTLYEDKYAPIAEATHYTFRKFSLCNNFFFFFLAVEGWGPLRKHAALKGTAM